MTDIEKKAREYYENEVVNGDSQDDRSGWMDCFMAGAAYALSNQWRDAEKEKPEYNEIVIARVCYKDGEEYHYYTTMASIPWLIRCWIDEGNRPLDDEDEYGKVTHWLPIPEYKPKGE